MNGNKQVRLSPAEQKLIKMLRLYEIQPERILSVFTRCIMQREMGQKEVTIKLDDASFFQIMAV